MRPVRRAVAPDSLWLFVAPLLCGLVRLLRLFLLRVLILLLCSVLLLLRPSSLVAGQPYLFVPAVVRVGPVAVHVAPVRSP